MTVRTKRTPSLRELRNNCPGNVAILPTAPARQVQQRYGRAYGQAKRELLASQARAFPYKPPWAREDERQAQSLELRADVPPFDPGIWRGDLDEKFPSIRMRTDRRGFHVVPALIDAGKATRRFDCRCATFPRWT